MIYLLRWAVFNKVFGIGLSRTGTLSLTAALNRLSIPTIHFPSDDLTFEQLRSGDFQLKVLDKFRGICDTPVAPYYPQLDEEFPGSKFILTIRDRDEWLSSTERFWRRTARIQRLPYCRFVNTSVYGVWEYSRDRFGYIYDLHLSNARRYFRDSPAKYLEMNICAGDGWSKLASFLGRSDPMIPFPHEDILYQWDHNPGSFLASYSARGAAQ